MSSFVKYAIVVFHASYACRAGPVWAVRDVVKVSHLSQHLLNKESGSKQRDQGMYVCTPIPHIFILYTHAFMY